MHAARIDGPGPCERSAYRRSRAVWHTLHTVVGCKIYCFTVYATQDSDAPSSQAPSQKLRCVCKAPSPAHCRSPKFLDMPDAVDQQSAWFSHASRLDSVPPANLQASTLSTTVSDSSRRTTLRGRAQGSKSQSAFSPLFRFIPVLVFSPFKLLSTCRG